MAAAGVGVKPVLYLVCMDLIGQLSRRAFWDVDIQTMDAEKHAAFIVGKVFEYGSLSDIMATQKHYGKQRTLELLLAQPYLQKDTLRFAASLFKVPPNRFACYTKTQSRQNVGSSLRR